MDRWARTEDIQALEVELLERQRHLHRVQRIPLLLVREVLVRRGDGLQRHAPAALVQKGHQVARVRALAVRLLAKVGGQAGQRHVVAVEVGLKALIDVPLWEQRGSERVSLDTSLGAATHERDLGVDLGVERLLRVGCEEGRGERHLRLHRIANNLHGRLDVLA